MAWWRRALVCNWAPCVGDDGGVVGSFSSSSSSVSSGSGIIVVVDFGRRFGNGHVRKILSNSDNESGELRVRAVKPCFVNNSTRFIRPVDVLKIDLLLLKRKAKKKRKIYWGYIDVSGECFSKLIDNRSKWIINVKNKVSNENLCI